VIHNNISFSSANVLQSFTILHTFARNREHGRATMVDFAREQPQTVSQLAAYFGIHPVTVRRWFQNGLEHAKPRGRGKAFSSREAVTRFLNPPTTSPEAMQAVVMDRETAAAIKYLAAQGIGAKDGQQRKTA
jgi:transposase-like protein